MNNSQIGWRLGFIAILIIIDYLAVPASITLQERIFVLALYGLAFHTVNMVLTLSENALDSEGDHICYYMRKEVEDG